MAQWLITRHSSIAIMSQKKSRNAGVKKDIEYIEYQVEKLKLIWILPRLISVLSAAGNYEEIQGWRLM